MGASQKQVRALYRCVEVVGGSPGGDQVTVQRIKEALADHRELIVPVLAWAALTLALIGLAVL